MNYGLSAQFVRRPTRTPMVRRYSGFRSRGLSGYDDLEGLGKFKLKNVVKSVAKVVAAPTKAVVKVAAAVKIVPKDTVKKLDKAVDVIAKQATKVITSAPKIAVATVVGAGTGFVTGGFAGAAKGAVAAGGNQALKASRTSKQISMKSTIKGAVKVGALTGALSRVAGSVAQTGLKTVAKNVGSKLLTGAKAFGKGGGLVGKGISLVKGMIGKKAAAPGEETVEEAAAPAEGESFMDKATDVVQKGMSIAKKVKGVAGKFRPSGGDGASAPSEVPAYDSPSASEDAQASASRDGGRIPKSTGGASGGASGGSSYLPEQETPGAATPEGAPAAESSGGIAKVLLPIGAALLLL
jgi:hypothetical protein